MRSKCLLVSNILATLYSAVLLYIFGGAIIQAGGIDYIEALAEYFDFAFEVLKFDSPTLTFLYVFLVLISVHVVTFVIGCLFGWIAFLTKKSGIAKFAATLYLIGSICFPIYLVFGLPITIIGFIGGSKQKIINRQSTAL